MALVNKSAKAKTGNELEDGFLHDTSPRETTMNRLSTFFFGIVVGAGGLFVSENYYVVRGKEAIHLIPKVASKIEIPYRDVRNFSVEDWKNNPSLALAIVKSQKQELLVESGLSGMQQQFEGLLRSFGG
jgi:hypothetical protein